MKGFSYRSIFKILSGNSVVMLSTLLIASIMVTNAGLDSYGYFITIQSILLACSVVAKPCTWVAILKYREDTCLHKLCKNSIKLELLVLVVFYFFYLFSHQYVENRYFLFFEKNIILVMMFLLVYNTGVVLGTMRAVERYGAISLMLTFSALLKVIFVYIKPDDPEWLICAFMSIDIVIWVPFIIYSLSLGLRANVLKKTQPVLFSDFTKTSMTATINQMMDLPVTQLDRVLVAFIAGDNSAAVYNLVRRLSSLLNQIGEPLFQVYSRQFSSKDFDFSIFKFSEMFVFSMKKIGLPLLICLCSYPLVIPFMDSYFFNNSLNNYYTLLFLFLLISAFSITVVWVNPLYYFHVSELKSVLVTMLTNILYAVSIFLIFTHLTIYQSYLCFLLQVLFNFMIKSLSIRQRVFTNFYKNRK